MIQGEGGGGLLKVSRLIARLPTQSAELQNCDKFLGKKSVYEELDHFIKYFGF